MAAIKALLKAKAESGFWLQDVPVPEIGINAVLSKIHRTAICGPNVHLLNWDPWVQKTIPGPMPVGHEFAGRIVKSGCDVQR